VSGNVPRVISSQRLCLRVPVRADHTTMQYWMDDAAFGRYSNKRNLDTSDLGAIFCSFLTEHWERYGFGFYAVERSVDSALIGVVGLKNVDAWAGAKWPSGCSRVELGFLIGPEHWHQGYATEAALTVLSANSAFDTIIARCDPENAAAISVLHKLGMLSAPEEVVHGSVHKVFTLTK
jgi:RimJ/RimL family protein N-acetyltransferase